MPSLKSVLAAGMLLFTILFVAEFPTTRCKYSAINARCGVYFNYSYFDKGTENFYSHQMNIYDTCINKTLQMFTERNLTRSERNNCFVKCFHIADGFYNENGTFDTKFLKRTREEYTKYSNASASFVNNLIKKFSECPKKVAEIYKNLDDTDKGECRISGLYRSCRDNITWNFYNNATKEELCGLE